MPRRIVIIGGGHNGLVCAACLAQDGHKISVLEAAGQIGGAAVTREFHPGFRVSAGAHLFPGLHPVVARRFNLAAHGLTGANGPLPTVALNPDGERLVLHPKDDRAALSLRARSAADADALPAFREQMRRFARLLSGLMTECPPRLKNGGFTDRATLMQFAWQIRRLGRRDMRELLRIFAMNAADLLDEHFETPHLRGALAADAVLGSRLGPRAPNTVFTWLYRLAAAPAGWSHPAGGLGSVTEALGGAARAAGAEIRTCAPVRRIVVNDGRATGVELASGEIVDADVVISNADPKRTFLELLGAAELDTGFVRRVRDIPTDGCSAKLHLALDALPELAGGFEPDLAGRLVIAPDIDYVERAHNAAKYGEMSSAPIMEITLPTLHDPGLAPAGKHVLSAVVQYAPYRLRQGWETGRDKLTRIALDTLAQYAPGIRDRIIAAEIVTPADFESDLGITGGHWHHGEMGLERFLMLRPVPGWAQYATPVPGLYLCGAGCHPGGGVIGAAGHNAALAVSGALRSGSA